jgi:histone H3/H4
MSSQQKGISKRSVKRLAKKEGVVRSIDLLYPDMTHSVKLYLDRVLKESVLLVEYSGRDKIEVKDVSAALAKHSKLLYGVQ